MSSWFPRAAITLSIVFLFGCGEEAMNGAPSPDETSAPDAELTSVATASVDSGGPLTTGITSLDSILQALLDGDQATVESALQFTEIGCTTVLGAGGPPKCANAPRSPGAGSPVSTFPVLHCEGGWEFDVKQTSGRLVSQDFELHSVYGLSGGGPLYNEDLLPVADFVIVLVEEMGNRTPELVFVADGRIVLTQTPCDPLTLPEDLLARFASEKELILEGPASNR